MKKIRLTAIVLVIIIGLLTLSGCNIKNLVNLLNSNSNSIVKETVLSTDEKFSIEVPSNWDKETQLNDAAIISVSNAAKEQYALVISELKEDFDDSVGIQEYYDIIKEQYYTPLKDFEIGTESRTTINGNNAITVDFKASSNGVKVAFWVYIVETTDSYNQLMGWTLQSKKEVNEETILTVMNSFKENN